jgi:hypothetical protein
MHEDDLENFWKGPLDKAEAGISRHNSWRIIIIIIIVIIMEDIN